MNRSGNPALWICLSSSFLKYCRKLAAQMLFNANYISSVYLISFCEDESLIYSRQFFYSTIWLRLRLHCLLSNLEPDTRVSLQYDASSILEGDLIQVCFNHIGIKEKEPEYSKKFRLQLHLHKLRGHCLLHRFAKCFNEITKLMLHWWHEMSENIGLYTHLGVYESLEDLRIELEMYTFSKNYSNYTAKLIIKGIL